MKRVKVLFQSFFQMSSICYLKFFHVTFSSGSFYVAYGLFANLFLHIRFLEPSTWSDKRVNVEFRGTLTLFLNTRLFMQTKLAIVFIYGAGSTNLRALKWSNVYLFCFQCLWLFLWPLHISSIVDDVSLVVAGHCTWSSRSLVTPRICITITML